MSVSEMLAATQAYLQQITGDIVQEDDSLDVPDRLIQEIGSASQNVINELEGRFTCIVSPAFDTNFIFRIQLSIWKSKP